MNPTEDIDLSHKTPLCFLLFRFTHSAYSFIYTHFIHPILRVQERFCIFCTLDRLKRNKIRVFSGLLLFAPSFIPLSAPKRRFLTRKHPFLTEMYILP